MPRKVKPIGRHWHMRQMHIAKMADDDDEPILDMDMEVYYVLMKRNGETFYMTDISTDGQKINWTRNRQDGLQFLGEDEADEYANQAKDTGRKGIEVELFEIQLELDVDLS